MLMSFIYYFYLLNESILGSWVRIPHEVWMYLCVYSVCVALCRLRLCNELIARPRSPTDFMQES
jgi:hypothetical protein